MSNAFVWLTSYVINAAWQLPILGAVGWGLSRCLRGAGPEPQHKIWVAVLILATLAPATPVFYAYFAHETPMGEVNVSRPAMLASVTGHESALEGGPILLLPIVIYLVSGLYVAVLLFYLLRLCWVLGCTSALVRKAIPASVGADHVAMWNRSKERFSVKAASLLCSRDVPGPVTAGLWRPVLLLPATFIEEHSRTEFLAAVGHECAHIRRNDFWKNVCYEIAGLPTAFHPVTWFIKSRIAHTREMICDRMAAEGLLDLRTYGESLLQLATKRATVHSAVFQTMGMFDANFWKGES